MSKNVNFDYWEQLPGFCGPRIPPGLRVRRIVDEKSRIDEAARRDEGARWVQSWRAACEAAGGNPQPRATAVVRKARTDAYIDQLIAQYGAKRCAGFGIRREDQKWLP
jgi:hypothetical protein